MDMPIGSLCKQTTTLISLISLFGGGLSAAAISYSAADDFSADSNPNDGPWSYGSTATLAGELVLYNAHAVEAGSGLDGWYFDPVPGGLLPPQVLHNGTGVEVTGGNGRTWEAGQLSMHPGPNNERSVVRWTAPEANRVEISTTFGLIDNGNVDVHVLHNSSSLFDSTVAGIGDSTSMTTQIVVSAGDTIDFVVGYGASGHSSDTASLQAAITTDPAPVLDMEFSHVRLCWQSVSNQVYQVQCSSGLASVVWEDVGSPVTGNGRLTCITNELTSPGKAYRLQLIE